MLHTKVSAIGGVILFLFCAVGAAAGEPVDYVPFELPSSDVFAMPSLPAAPKMPAPQELKVKFMTIPDSIELPRPDEAPKSMPKLVNWPAPQSRIRDLRDYEVPHLEWPVQGLVSSPFGIRKLGRRTKQHAGIDIPTPIGTPVQASLAGRVLLACYLNGYGHTVIIEHGRGVQTLYAHCSELLVEPGQKVKVGQVIAVSGNSGRSTMPHLHLGVSVAGEFSDPMKFLSEPVRLARRPSK